jgi:hypothetical protein
MAEKIEKDDENAWEARRGKFPNHPRGRRRPRSLDPIFQRCPAPYELSPTKGTYRLRAAFKRVLRFSVGRDFCGPPGDFLDHASEDHAVDRVKREPINKSKESLGREKGCLGRRARPPNADAKRRTLRETASHRGLVASILQGTHVVYGT